MVDPEPSLDELLALANGDDPIAVERARGMALRRMGAEPRAAAIAATAFDRARVLAGLPQKFGTQVLARVGGAELWPVDPATTDSERAKWGLGPLARWRAEAAARQPTVTKPCLRRLLRARRGAIPPAAAAASAQAIAAAGEAALAARARGAVVAAYWPLAAEADPRPLAHALVRHGARLALPVVDGDAMRFRSWDLGAELAPAGFGTLGPAPSAAEVWPAIVLAPLLGCDATGARLGQGKGFYDRALAAAAGAARPLVVGVAFACQELPAVPTERHDLHLDALVTERGFRSFAR